MALDLEHQRHTSTPTTPESICKATKWKTYNSVMRRPAIASGLLRSSSILVSPPPDPNVNRSSLLQMILPLEGRYPHDDVESGLNHTQLPRRYHSYAESGPAKISRR